MALPMSHGPQRSLSLRLRQWWNGFCEIGLPWLVARHRSIELLKQNLSVAQRRQYETRYRIRHGYQMNVQQFDRRGQRLRMLCFMPKGRLGVGDIMLAQKLALELFEDEAIKVAKKTAPDPARSTFP